MNILARTLLFSFATTALGLTAADPARLAIYLEELKSPDVEIRRAALDSLDELKPKSPAFVEALPKLLNDPDDNIRSFASSIIALHIPDGPDRAARVLPLLEVVPARNRGPLLEVLKELGPHARPALRKVCAMLGEINESGDLLISSHEVLLALAHTTGAVKPKNPFEQAEQKADDSEAGRKKAFEADMKVFLPDLSAPDADKRLSAAIHFAQYQTLFGSSLPDEHRPAITAAFAPLILDPDAGVQRFALWALAQNRLSSSQSEAPLLQLVTSPDAITASLSLRALGKMEFDVARVLPWLKQNLESDDPRRVFAAVDAIEQYRGEAAPLATALLPLLKKSDPAAQPKLLKALAGTRAPAATPTLARYAESKDSSVRRAALDYLDDRLPPPEIGVVIFEKALNDSDSFNRYLARRALAEYGYYARAALPALFELKVPDAGGERDEIDKIIQEILEHRYRGGGFSDTPPDEKALTPPELSEAYQRDAVRRIEPFLNSPHAGLAANALQALASFEKVELSPLWKQKLPQIMTQPGNGMLSGLKAIGYLGPRAADFLPMLLKNVNDYPAPALVHTLFEIGSDRAEVREILTLLLPREPRAAALLAQTPLGREILVRELYSKNDATRLNACVALGDVNSLPPDAAEPLWLLTKSTDVKLAAAALKALLNLENLAPPSLDEIRKLLDHNAPEIHAGAMSLCERLGPEALPLRAKLVEIALSRREGSDAAVPALLAIGLDDATAKKFAALPVKPPNQENPDDIEFYVPILLANRPVELLQFLKARPGYFHSKEKISYGAQYAAAPLFALFSHTGPDHDAIRALALAEPSLSWVTMAAIGDPKLLPRFDADLAAADAYSRHFITACARACGRPGVRAAVRISATEPGNFKPKSAWPNVDSSRMARRGGGHGDGTVTILITGTLKLADGGAVKNPRFFGTNDRYLLGRQQKNREPIKYDAQTGRFIFCSEVFAAFQNGGEPGPYQTGSAETLIESDNAEPLKVQFYDEMPDVEIVLTPKRK